jgi:hypothetical protein
MLPQSQPQPQVNIQTQPQLQPAQNIQIQPQPQPLQQVVVTNPQPVVVNNDLRGAVLQELKGRTCCLCFSYPVGIQILAILEIIYWLIVAIAYIWNGWWWLFLFAGLALVMCYFGFMGARNLNSSYLKLYLVYLVINVAFEIFTIIYIILFHRLRDIILPIVTAAILLYFCYVVSDFINVIDSVRRNPRRVAVIP